MAPEAAATIVDTTGKSQAAVILLSSVWWTDILQRGLVIVGSLRGVAGLFKTHITKGR